MASLLVTDGLCPPGFFSAMNSGEFVDLFVTFLFKAAFGQFIENHLSGFASFNPGVRELDGELSYSAAGCVCQAGGVLGRGAGLSRVWVQSGKEGRTSQREGGV